MRTTYEKNAVISAPRCSRDICFWTETSARRRTAESIHMAAHETYTLANGMKVTLVPYGNIPKSKRQSGIA